MSIFLDRGNLKSDFIVGSHDRGPVYPICHRRRVVRSKHATALIASLFLVLIPASVCSTKWYVNGVTGRDANDCKSLTSACKTLGHTLSLASSGDSIMVAAATYKENLTVAIDVSIIGSGAAKTIVDGGGVNRVFVISSGANVNLSKLTVRNGYALSGAGIGNSGTLTIKNSVVTANTAHEDCESQTCGNDGGGIQNAGTLTLNNSSVKGNTVSMTGSCPNHCYSVGAGIWNIGTLVINRSTVIGNSASVSCPRTGHCYSDGGGIHNAGDVATATISGSTISGNKSRYGGGIVNGGTLTLTNSTVSTNSGSGISNTGVSLLINNSTISGNNTDFSMGGGIDLVSGTVALQNSIVANNVANNIPANCNGTVTSTGYNLSSDDTCSFNGSGDLNNTDPQLGPLHNNGGPTQTMALPSGSPAIDAGNPNGCTDSLGNLLKTDQRGKPRPDPEDSGGCDMGAYERQSE